MVSLLKRMSATQVVIVRDCSSQNTGLGVYTRSVRAISQSQAVFPPGIKVSVFSSRHRTFPTNSIIQPLVTLSKGNSVSSGRNECHWTAFRSRRRWLEAIVGPNLRGGLERAEGTLQEIVFQRPVRNSGGQFVDESARCRERMLSI
jgi:hypothetical protein